MIDYGLWCKGWMTDDTVVRVRFQVQKMVCASLRLSFVTETFDSIMTLLQYQ